MRNGCHRHAGLIVGLILAAGAVRANPTVSNITFVDQKRIDRFVIEATYRADITSSGGAFTSVTGTVTSTGLATTIVEGSPYVSGRCIWRDRYQYGHFRHPA